MQERSKNPTGLMIHCAASENRKVNAKVIRRWHKKRGWDDIGYNWVITSKGVLETGRDRKYLGAHCIENKSNERFLSVCLVGRDRFNLKQIERLFILVKELRECNVIDYFTDRTPITFDNLKGHYEMDTHGKTCPNIDMLWLRELMNAWLFKDRNDGFMI